MRELRLSAALTATFAITACTTEPVLWDAPQYGPPTTLARGPSRCEARAVTAAGGHSYEVWWQPLSVRPVFVLAARRERDTVVVIDRRGETSDCDALPPPFAFADSTNGYLHVSYSSGLSGRAGVYYAHSMNAPKLSRRREGMFEPPIAIVYGDRPVRTSVAARGDTVVVAYEDPNSPAGGVWIALSTTAGHAFSHWLRLTDRALEASRPAVELRAGAVTVRWVESAGGTTRVVTRRGRFR